MQLDKNKEIWKDIDGYQGLYQISNLGNVKSLKRKGSRIERILKPYRSKHGYLNVILRINNINKNYQVHRLVMESFVDNPEKKLTVNHLDGIKSNNNLSNLEWNTYSENLKHAFNIGLNSNVGIKNPRSKLNEKQVRIIRSIGNKMKQIDISDFFGVGRVAICNILNNKRWRHI